MPSPQSIKRVLLFAQVDPPIHGQAIMASLLAGESERWADCSLSVINAVYATDRAKLGSFSFGKFFRWLGYLARVATTVIFRRIDVVVITHAFFRGPFLKDSAFVWLIKRLLGRKLLVWVHMDPRRLDLGHAPVWLVKYAGKTFPLPDRWIACAPALIGMWPEEMRKERTAAVCNGIPDAAAGRQADPASNHRVVFLSSMTDEKGWRELFAVGEKLCDEDPDLEVVFYGDPGAGETAETLETIFANGRWPQRVTWRGAAWGERKAEALRSAGVFCFPSWTEAFPLAVLDAMAFGVPVISSDVGAVRDAVVAGKGGWLVPARDERALEAALREALASPQLRHDAGIFNRARFLEKFSVRAFGNAWHDLLMTV